MLATIIALLARIDAALTTITTKGGTGGGLSVADTNSVILALQTLAAKAEALAGSPTGTGVPDTSLTAAISAITASSVMISWTTPDVSSTQVEYGLDTTYGTLTMLDPAQSLAHVVHIVSLTPGTLFHFRVRSVNATGFLQSSADATFTTLAA